MDVSGLAGVCGCQTRGQPIGRCDGFAACGVVRVEFLLQLLQLWRAQQRLKSFAGSCCAEKPRGRVVEAVLDGWQKNLDESRTGDGLDFDGLILQLEGGVALDDFLDPQTLGTSAACGIRALLDALAMNLSCAQASGLE
jgi:hypothetical protein